MASKETKTIRFAVGTKKDPHSSIWRLWATGDELYLAARSYAAISKISFHKSGINRYAVNEKAERKNDASDRALYKWQRAKELIPGWTEGFGILVPPRITRNPFSNVIKTNKPIQFVKTPKPNKKVIFKILLSHKMAKPENVKRLISHELTIHGFVEMHRELAWLISFSDDFTQKEYGVVLDHFNKLKIHLKPGSTGEEVHYAFLHALEMRDRPFLTDIELGRENLDIPLS